MRVRGSGWISGLVLVLGLSAVASGVCLAAEAGKSVAKEKFYDNERVWKSDDPNFNFRRSEHFRVIWGKGVGEGNVNNDYALMNEQRVQGHLQSLERIWHKYHDPEPAGLGFYFPGFSTDPSKNDGKRYRCNFAFNNTGIWEGGAWGATDEAGYQLFAINPGFISYDPPTGATAHEYGHTIQINAGGFNETPFDGMWHEAGANWLDCQFIDDQAAGPMPTTHFFSLPHGRDYYHCYQIFEYLREQPEYGVKFYNTLWTKANGNKAKGGEYIFDAMARLDPSGSPDSYNKVKDILGHVGEHVLTWDFERGVFWRQQAPLTSDPLNMNYRIGMSELVRVTGDKEWFRPPFEHAPSQGGYDWVPIALKGKKGGGYTVKVDFQPLWDASRGSDWRACFVAVNDNGEPRYGNQWNSGVNGIKLSADENKLYLVVTAVPDFKGFEGFARPLISDPILFPQAYKVRFVDTLATAYESGPVPIPEGVKGKTHSNGGGFVADTAKVDESAYVGPNARVLGNAQVLEDARIEDCGVVMGDAVVKGSVVVSGHGLVKDKAEVSGEAKVRDWATVGGSWKVYESGRVLEHANLVDRGQLHGYATIKGVAADFGNCDVKGYAIKDGDCSNGANLDKSVLMCWVWGTDQEYANGRPDTGGVYCQYDFERTSPNYALDKFGTIHGYLMGKPIVGKVADEALNNVLVLNGKDQYIELRKDVFDFPNTTIAMWVNPSGGAVNQCVFSYGSGAKYMSLTPKDSSDKVRFVIDDGKGNRRVLVGETTLPANKWSHVAVTFWGSDSASLFVDGKVVDREENMNGLTPDDLVGPNTVNGGTYAYIGRDAKGNYFKGYIDDFQVYTSDQDEFRMGLLAEQVKDESPLASVALRATVFSSLSEKRVTSAFRMAPATVSDTAIKMTASRPNDGKDTEYYFKCVSGGGHDSGWISGSMYVDCGLQAGKTYAYTVKVKSGGMEIPESKPVKVTIPMDTFAPKYVKSEWESAPRGISDTAIKMVAGKATDANQLIEYKFTRNDGKTSGWKSTQTWIDSGLKPGAKYSYTVQVRDGSGNTRLAGKAVSAVAKDVTPPARFVKGEWTCPAYALVDNKIALRARPVHADKGLSIEDNEVEYYFKCVSGNGPDSGWIESSKWDTPVLPDDKYVYQFKIRDKSPQLNETGWSAPEYATVSYMTGYHAYKVGQIKSLPESALVSFTGKVTDVGKDYYTVSADGASVKVMPRTKGSATEASLEGKTVSVKGGTWVVSDEQRVTWADVEESASL